MTPSAEALLQTLFECASIDRPEIEIESPEGELLRQTVIGLNATTLKVDGGADLKPALDANGICTANICSLFSEPVTARLRCSLSLAPSLHWTCEVLDHQDDYRKLAGQHLLATTTHSPSRLRAAQLSFYSVQRALCFAFADCPADYDDVLALRHIAYSSVGKADPTSRPEVMADGFDTGARILCARHGSRLVGTARLALPSATERTEYDEFVRVPEWVDRRSLAVLSRIATDAAYRGANLLYSLVLRCVAEAASHDRRFILGGCTDALLPVYERVGARTTGLIFRHGQLANTQENLIVFDSHEILKGRGVRPDLWQEVLQPMNGRRG
jgi:hypothetical protein